MVPLVLFNGAPSDAKSLSLAGFQQILQLGLQENQQGKKAPALVHGRNRPSSPVIREKKRKEKKIFPEGVWLSCLLTVTWMPTLNGSCPGARPKPPQLPLRRRVTVQPPHGDVDAHAQRLLPWFTVSVPSQLPRGKPPLAKRTPPLLREIRHPPHRSRQSRYVAPVPHLPRAHLHLHTTPYVHRKRNKIVT